MISETDRNSSGSKVESCTANTDRVDREIRQLKEEKRKLEQQLADVEAELQQKDNDAYRRQNAVYYSISAA